ncbi:MAG: serine/threonine-protein kinase [Gemmatimonadaceae bacterium]
MRCPRCGTVYASDTRFCTRDGLKLVAEPDAPTSRSAEWPQYGPRSSPGAKPVSSTPRPAVATPSQATMTGRMLDGRYQIDRKVGEGGMSFVYLAKDTETNEQVAIKILSPALSADRNSLARLRREATLAGRLAHRNVCHIIRLGETDTGMAYVVMPFVEGELLCDRTHRLGHIPLPDVVTYVRDIAAGLQVAHQLRIIHRDLKPENVMLCPEPGGTERAVVMDFGLAKDRRAGAEAEKLTATGIVLGTPEFMSPEQLRGRPLDPRSDVYSLALMTFEMLTGKLPFEGRSQQELMIARLRSDPIPLRRMRPELAYPVDVERALLKGMARDANDRYATAPDFAEALARAASGDDTELGFLDRLLRR